MFFVVWEDETKVALISGFCVVGSMGEKSLLLVYCCWQGLKKQFKSLQPFPSKVSCLKPEEEDFVLVSVGLV